MEGTIIKHTKGKFRSYAAVAQCLKQHKEWAQYEWNRKGYKTSFIRIAQNDKFFSHVVFFE